MSNSLSITVIGLVVIGWGSRLWAEDDVTIMGAPPAPGSALGNTALAPDGTPVVHKSFHKKSENGDGTSLTGKAPWGNGSSSSKPSQVTTIAAPNQPSSLGPTVETGLPVARHNSMMGSTTVNPAPIPITATVPSAAYSDPTIFQHKSTPSPIFPGTSTTTVASYSPSITTTSLEENGPEASNESESKREPKTTYPWKTNIITTMFYIGEGDTPISRMTNEASAWDEDWRSNNGGADSPTYRVGLAPATHAARVNPFYVALPFNDLAYPDKARRWLPKGWYRPPRDGKQVSACQHRWVEIKTEDGSGRYCFAQWEDVGPLRSDHPEYVFGSERPIGLGDNHAGLDVSPAVRDYLRLDSDKKATTRWRFVDDVDVPPGDWLKFDEEAVIYRAMHEMKTSPPIQKAEAPIEDQQGIDSNERRVGAAKG